MNKAKISCVVPIIPTLKKIKENLTFTLSDRLRSFPSEPPAFQLSFITVCRQTGRNTCMQETDPKSQSKLLLI